jgi:CubicO group peptidase (beta-lactamase class C family)
MQVEGFVAPGFEPVADAVAACGPGVNVAAFVDGRLAVDVHTSDLRDDSLVCTWSSVKPVTGACLLSLVDRGLVALDDPVVSVWPEVGDDRLQVRHLLTHTAGRITPPAVPLTDWAASTTALAAQPPDWAPGEVLCEHALTFGHLVGEVVRRVDGRTLGRFLADEITGPLGLDLHVGVHDDDLHRVADTVGLDADWWEDLRGTPGSPRHRSLGGWVDVNDPVWRRAEIPAVNAHTTARGLAGFWQAYLDGRLPAGLGLPGATGHDHFVDDVVTWSLAGGRVESLGGGGVEVGMGGVGGQWAGARPSDGLAWSFLTTHMGDHDRCDTVERALLHAIDA